MALSFLPRIVGRCIYCPAEQADPEDPDAPFGEEHVIPRGLGGKRVLQKASCRKCEGITSAIETQCIDFMVSHGRPELGLYGRRARSRARARQRASALGPSVMFTFRLLSPPGILSIAPRAAEAAPAAIGVLFGRRLASGPPHFRHFQFRHGGASTQIFSRLLAKIGHAHAVDALGLDGFTPIALDLINGVEPPLASYLVGAPLAPDTTTTEQHSISHQWLMAPNGQEFLVVRVRLFGNRGPHIPSYVVVVGTRPAVKTSN